MPTATTAAPGVGLLRDDRGLGLPELLVAMLLLAILMTVVISAFSSFTASFTEDRSATDSTNVASVGINEVTRVVRSGTEIPVKGQNLNKPVFVAAESERIVVHAFLDTDSASPKPLKVEFSINAKRELIETRWLAKALGGGYWDFETVADSSRIVARQIIVPTGSEPSLFGYVRADGTAIVAPTGSQLREIAAVEVTMKVQADVTSRAKPVTITNRVGIPNLGISRVGL